MDPWTALLAHATAERQLAAEGRWEELAESTAERVRMAAALGPVVVPFAAVTVSPASNSRALRGRSRSHSRSARREQRCFAELISLVKYLS